MDNSSEIFDFNKVKRGDKFEDTYYNKAKNIIYLKPDDWRTFSIFLFPDGKIYAHPTSSLRKIKTPLSIRIKFCLFLLKINDLLHILESNDINLKFLTKEKKYAGYTPE